MITVNVSSIQHFSTGDGPGIRTTVFLKGCNLHCPWCHNPETISPLPQTLVFPNTNKSITYGIRMSVEDLLKELTEDADFYKASGGGVTFGGGEPLLQAEAVATMAKALRDREIESLVDTTGSVPWSHFEAVLPFVDRFYFDWKSDDPKLCARVIGADHALISDNLRRLLEAKKEVHVRIPLIPHFNTADSVCQRICEQLHGIGVTQVDLLPFHRLGSGKYAAMGLRYAYGDQPPLSDAELAQIVPIFQKHFDVSVEK